MAAVEGGLKIRCPKCNSDNLDWHKEDREWDEWWVLTCKDCGKVFVDYESKDENKD